MELNFFDERNYKTIMEKEIEVEELKDMDDIINECMKKCELIKTERIFDDIIFIDITSIKENKKTMNYLDISNIVAENINHILKIFREYNHNKDSDGLITIAAQFKNLLDILAFDNIGLRVDLVNKEVIVNLPDEFFLQNMTNLLRETIDNVKEKTTPKKRFRSLRILFKFKKELEKDLSLIAIESMDELFKNLSAILKETESIYVSMGKLLVGIIKEEIGYGFELKVERS